MFITKTHAPERFPVWLRLSMGLLNYNRRDKDVKTAIPSVVVFLCAGLKSVYTRDNRSLFSQKTDRHSPPQKQTVLLPDLPSNLYQKYTFIAPVIYTESG